MTTETLKLNREEIINELIARIGAENVKSAMFTMINEVENYDTLDDLITDAVYQFNRLQRKPDSKRITILAALAEMED